MPSLPDALPIFRDQPVLGDDRHFLCEPVDMVGFLLEEAQGNEEREIEVLDARILDRGVHHRLDAFLDAIAPRLDDHAAANPRFLGEVGLCNDILITGRSEEHTSELQPLMRISYAVFCLKKKINTN